MVETVGTCPGTAESVAAPPCGAFEPADPRGDNAKRRGIAGLAGGVGEKNFKRRPSAAEAEAGLAHVPGKAALEGGVVEVNSFFAWSLHLQSVEGTEGRMSVELAGIEARVSGGEVVDQQQVHLAPLAVDQVDPLVRGDPHLIGG